MTAEKILRKEDKLLKGLSASQSEQMVFFTLPGIGASHVVNCVLTSYQSPKDVESAVNSRIAQYQAYIEEIAEYYEESAQHINADQDIHTVFECIESIIVNPIPTKNEV